LLNVRGEIKHSFAHEHRISNTVTLLCDKKSRERTTSAQRYDMTSASDTLSFRDARYTDLPGIVALLRDDELGAKRNPAHDLAIDAYVAAWAEILADPNNGYVVAERDGCLVGCYQLTFVRGLSHTGGLRAQIESVRIASNLRGGGLGSVMMRDAVARARARGAFLVQLTTDVRREHTRHFYERLGFVASHHGMKLFL
jgi:ribosomal protein S18 acetylase RimI-like enzyme